MPDEYAKKYPRKDPMVERMTTKQRVDGPNTRQQRRAHGRYLDYGPMPLGYERSHTRYAKWLRTQGKTGGRTRRRHRKSRSTRRR
jgi:hypothetical protein